MAKKTINRATKTNASATAKTTAPRSKKKIVSEDFLHLLDEQEARTEKVAFKPKKKREVEPGFQLTPVQQELVDFALKHSPKFVQNLVRAPKTQRIFREMLKRWDAVRTDRLR